MSLNISFAGKTILITGGMGRQLVKRFYEGGATVCTVDKNPTTVEQLRKDFPHIRAEIVDLTDWAATKRVVESFGAIDHLINNAGMVVIKDLLSITEDEAAIQRNTNLLAGLNVTQCVAKGMIARGVGGSIVNTSSASSKRVERNRGVYSASKAGVKNLTKTMAVELATHNIRVNCIRPGMTDTPLVASKPEIKKEMLERTLVKRLINPNEIADTAIFLLSPAASMITGQAVVVDGGYTIT